MFPKTIYLKSIIYNLFSFVKDPNWNVVYIICEYISYHPDWLTAPFFLMSNKMPVSKCAVLFILDFHFTSFKSTIGHHENMYKYLFRRSYLFSSIVSAVLNYGQLATLFFILHNTGNYDRKTYWSPRTHPVTNGSTRDGQDKDKTYLLKRPTSFN